MTKIILYKAISMHKLETGKLVCVFCGDKHMKPHYRYCPICGRHYINEIKEIDGQYFKIVERLGVIESGFVKLDVLRSIGKRVGDLMPEHIVIAVGEDRE